MSFVIKDDDVPNKYNEIQDQIKEKLNIKFHSMAIFDEKYIKAKIREFNGEFITNFLVNEIPNKSMYYTCMA